MIRMQLTNLLTLAAVFATACTYAGDPAALKATVSEVQVPERVFTNATGGIVVDFGKDAFGWLEIDAPAAGLDYFLNIGEVLRETTGHVDRKPGPCVRARGVKWHTEKAGFQRVPVAPDLRNLFTAGEGSPARLPEKYGVVTPFRAVEFYQADFPVTAQTVRRHVITYPADRNESSFSCDDAKLVKVYDFCKYSMFATSFAGMFVDGDRERIPYEADTYASQLNWYAVSSDYAYPRAAIEYLYSHPTWPTEFKLASVLSAWTDWMWTGDTSSLARHYETLKDEKMLLGHMRESDGLLVSGGERQPWPCYTNHCGLADIVDWPKTEREDFDFRDVNAVVNAFHVRTLEAMRDIAGALGKRTDADDFAARAVRARQAFAKVFVDPASGLVVDGEGSRHSSVQANAIALCFGLVPHENVGRVADWLVSQGMGCSVYFAQYLLEGLFRAGRADAAFALMTAENNRSWLGMLAQGATITTEAWNLQVKPNMDFNHAWGATAINVISRFVLGVTPCAPGFRKISIAPNFGPLRKVSATVPTQAGPVRIEFADGRLSVASPAPATVIWRGSERAIPGDGQAREIASLSPSAVPVEREYIWPEGKMPDVQAHQVAAKTAEKKAPGFEADGFRRPYLEWYAPNPATSRVDLCVLFISGGGFNSCCDAARMQPAIDRFVQAGVTVASLTYRTPRPVGLPIHQSGWEDAQRAVRVIRSQAAKRGFSPDKIGATGISAGAKLLLLLATSSETRAYEPVDAIDELPCNLLFAIPQAPAYVLTDGATGKNARQGDAVDVKLVPEFKFDAKTCPMCFFQGGLDEYSPNGSTQLYRQLRRMKIPAELHLFAGRPHGFHGDMNRGEDGTAWDHWFFRALEFVRQMNYDGRLGDEVKLMDRYASDADRALYEKLPVWPDGRMPDVQTNQSAPFLEWHVPKKLTTKAIQVIYSGGAYRGNDTGGFEVAPARRYLNAKGMTVVTMKYRTPRPLPESGLAKHTTAWQDLQRTIRIVRSEAKARGLDPDRIGIMGSSAGGHLTLMGATSSQRQSYLPIDSLDKIPCNVQWAVAIYPAYALTDGGENPNAQGGNEDDARLVRELSFDPQTCPMLFVHGDADGWAAMNSVKCWEQLRRMGIPSDLHTLATRKHCFQRQAAPGTGSYTWLDRIWEFMNDRGINRFE